MQQLKRGKAVKDVALAQKVSRITVWEIRKTFEDFRKSRDSNKFEYVQGKKKFAERFFNPPLKNY